MDTAKEMMKKRRREKPKSFRFDPQVVLTWKGSNYKSIVKRNYGGLEVTFISYGKGPGVRG